MINALTVDVEDYFHTEAASAAVTRDHWDGMPRRVDANTLALMEILEQHGVKATFFFLGWVAERFPSLVRQAVAAGHEIGCHSYWHRPLFRLTAEQFREDTKRAKAIIEDAGGVEVKGYRAPSFSLVKGTEWAPEILASLGFSYDSSVNPIRHDFYSNAGAPRRPYLLAQGALWEVPIATVRFAGQNLPIGGGAYLRILPLRYMQWGLRRLNQTEQAGAMIYLHPWELDYGQPRFKLSARSMLRSYTNLSHMQQKFEALLQGFSFAPALSAFPELQSLASQSGSPNPFLEPVAATTS